MQYYNGIARPTFKASNIEFAGRSKYYAHL